jgi:hypothetical protein
VRCFLVGQVIIVEATLVMRAHFGENKIPDQAMFVLGVMVYIVLEVGSLCPWTSYTMLGQHE